MNSDFMLRPSHNKPDVGPTSGAPRLERLARAAAAVLLAACSATPARAASPHDSPALADLTIEQLMNESVTSVSKRETSLDESAAAISVIGGDDILSLIHI